MTLVFVSSSKIHEIQGKSLKNDILWHFTGNLSYGRMAGSCMSDYLPVMLLCLVT